MLCNSCRKSLTTVIRRTQFRAVATAPATSSSSSINPPPVSSNQGSPATSSATAGTSQPLSTATLPSTSSAKSTDAGDTLKRINLRSSVPGGSELKGIAYLKAKPHVMAKEDDEYPDWLWSLLDSGKQSDGKSAVDLAALSKKQRTKYERKQAKMMKDVPKPIPMHEQSSDLTRSDDSADVSLQKRQELTKSSREARRKTIRESNFLRGM